MSKAQKPLRGVTQTGEKIRCLTAPGHGTSRNVGEPWWNTLEQIQAEMDKPAPRFFVDRGKQVDGDDLAAIKDVTDEDARQLNIRGIFRYSQIVKPEGALAVISFKSYFQHSQAEESRRRMAVRHFREAVHELGIEGALGAKTGLEPGIKAELLAIGRGESTSEDDVDVVKYLSSANSEQVSLLTEELKEAFKGLIGSPGARKAPALAKGLLEKLKE